MIRHIVLFKIKQGTSIEKIHDLVRSLKNLRESIFYVYELEVGLDIGKKSNSYDIALNSVFENSDDLEAYAVHPEHVKILKKVSELCESTVKVDFTFWFFR